MRTVSDADIEAQAKQPDIPYLSISQMMDVADSLNYTFDDYVAFCKAAAREHYIESVYNSHRESIRAQTADYLAECVDNQNSILAAHW